MNKQVKIDKRTIFYPEWFNRGVKFVNDFVNDDGSFLTLDQFSKKFGFCVNFLQYNGVISSLRQMLKLYPYGDKSSNLQTPFVPSSLQNIFRSSKGSKDMYTILNKKVVFLQLKENGIQFSILIQMSGNKFIYFLLKLQHVQNYIGFNLE